MLLFFLADYEYYYDYTTDSPAEDTDFSDGDWLFELLDVKGNFCIYDLLLTVLLSIR